LAISNATSPTYVLPSSVSGCVPRGQKPATFDGSTDQCRKDTLRQSFRMMRGFPRRGASAVTTSGVPIRREYDRQSRCGRTDSNADPVMRRNARRGRF
jgi:hypothetical protein